MATKWKIHCHPLPKNQTNAAGMEEVIWNDCLVFSSLPIGSFRNWQNFELLILPLALLGCHQIRLLHSPLPAVTQRCCFGSEQSQQGLGHQTLKRAPRTCHKPGFQRRNKVLGFSFYTSFFPYCFLLGCWPGQWPHQLALSPPPTPAKWLCPSHSESMCRADALWVCA